MSVVPHSVDLSAWQNFYVIVGSSGGSLVGLQFVAIALLASTRTRADFRAIHAFGTPNVVLFGSALTLAAIMCAPWSTTRALSVPVGICGLLGLAHAAVTFRRTRRQTVYKPVLEDWLCYVAAPGCAYAVLTLAAVALGTTGHRGLFPIAGATLGLLLTGLRNAWDSVTHIVISGGGGSSHAAPPEGEGRTPE